MTPAIARGLYLTLQRLRREPLPEALADVRRCERMSLDELLALQARRQLDQLRYAEAHVPFYRQVLAPYAGDLARARDWNAVSALLAHLPVIEKASVVDTPVEFTSDEAARLHTHLDKTSGSSGTPVIFPCDQRAWAYRHALTHRCMEAFGVAIGEPYALFFGLHWSRRKRAEVAVRDQVFNRVRISAYEVGPAHLESHFAAICRKRPTHIQGYPSAIYDFCVLLTERGMDLRSLRLKAVFSTAEPLRQHQRTLIESVTGSRCVDMYGSAEGGVVALECPAGGLHTTPESTWLSIRDTPSRSGEAVITDFMLRAFPMIQYAMGDEVVRRDDRCPCGRAQPLLASVEGRAGEPITLPNGKRINANLPSYIFKSMASMGVIRRYRFVQEGAANLTLFLVVTESFAPEHERLVRAETHRAFGADVAFEIRIVPELQHLPNAKHRDYVYV